MPSTSERSGERASERPRTRGNAAERILAAAAECVGQLGAAQVSLQTVADSAGVSKALIHYHFRDRDELLARLVDWVTVQLVQGEDLALAEADATTALDALWRWLEGELGSGRLRALGELAGERGSAVRDAVRRSREARRAQATLTIERLFAVLSLTPRLPAPLVGDVTVAFLDGLAGEVAVEPEGNHRLRFDVFWLSVLSLAE
jgi:AcrR family transcriptional regulator